MTPTQSTRTITVEMTKDEAVAIVGAINFAAQADRAFEHSEPTMSAYQRVQAGLRDYFGIDHPKAASS